MFFDILRFQVNVLENIEERFIANENNELEKELSVEELISIFEKNIQNYNDEKVDNLILQIRQSQNAYYAFNEKSNPPAMLGRIE